MIIFLTLKIIELCGLYICKKKTLDSIVMFSDQRMSLCEFSFSLV